MIAIYINGISAMDVPDGDWGVNTYSMAGCNTDHPGVDPELVDGLPLPMTTNMSGSNPIKASGR